MQMVKNRRTFAAFVAEHFTLFMMISSMLTVLGLWGLYGPGNGFKGETNLILLSDLSPGFEGFFYSDPLRKFTSVFYHLTYIVSAWIGVPGSFIPYQVIYAILWAARGVLTYLLIKELMPGRPALAVLAGLLTTLHTGDTSLNWIGQLNQMGFVFWTLSSMVLFAHAQTCYSTIAGFLLAVGSAFAGYLAIWSYESPFTVLAAFPIAVALVLRPLPTLRFSLTTAVFLIPIASFAVLNLRRYLSQAGATTYQAGVLRSDWTLQSLTTDLYYHVRNAFEFWSWPHVGFHRAPIGDYPLALIPIAVALVLTLPSAFAAERRMARPYRLDDRFLRFALAFFGLLIAAYLVPIILADNRKMWRTEFLASFAAGTLMAWALYALIGLLGARRWIEFSAVFLVSVMAAFSVQCGVNAGWFFRTMWEQHRLVIASVLRDAPRLADGTVVVLRQVDLERDPFGHNMWFDLALRVAYPGTALAGVYYFQDGRPAPGANIMFAKGEPRLEQTGFPTWFHQFTTSPVRHVLVFDYDPTTGGAHLVVDALVAVGDQIPVRGYHPCAAVRLTSNDIGTRRFGRLRDDRPSHCSGRVR